MTLEEFQNILSNNKAVVCKIGATWCQPCHLLDKTLEEVKKEYSDKVMFLNLDSEDDGEVVASLRVRNVPTMFYYKDGEVKSKTVGVIPQDKIKSNIEEIL